MFLYRSRKPQIKVEVEIEKEDLMYLVQGHKSTFIDGNETVVINSSGLSEKDIAQIHYTRKIHDLYEHYMPVFTTRSGGFVMSRDIWIILDKPKLWMSWPVYVVEGQDYLGVGRHPDDVGAEWGGKDATD